MSGQARDDKWKRFDDFGVDIGMSVFVDGLEFRPKVCVDFMMLGHGKRYLNIVWSFYWRFETKNDPSHAHRDHLRL